MLTDSELNIVLEDYVLFCSENDRYACSSIRGIFSAIEKFLIVNDRTMNRKKLMMFLPEERIHKQKAITTEQTRDLLSASSNLRSKAIVHLFCATGCRPEGMADLKMKDLDFMAHGFIGITFYSGHKHEFQHFCHSETTNAINDYLDERKQKGEEFTPETYVFCMLNCIGNESGRMQASGIGSVIEHLMRSAKIERTKVGKRYDLPACNCLRNRFNTILKRNSSIPYPIAESFMDHKVRMEGSYNFPTKLELLDEYKKVVLELIVSKEVKLKLENEMKEKEILKLEDDKGIEIKKMQLQIDSMLEMFSTAKALMKTNH
jgi:integrase